MKRSRNKLTESTKSTAHLETEISTPPEKPRVLISWDSKEVMMTSQEKKDLVAVEDAVAEVVPEAVEAETLPKDQDPKEVVNSE